MSSLSDKDRKLIVLYATAGLYKWDELEECGREAYDAGACEAEVVGCVRHLVVCVAFGGVRGIWWCAWQLVVCV